MPRITTGTGNISLVTFGGFFTLISKPLLSEILIVFPIFGQNIGGDDSFGDKAVATLHTFTDSLNLEDFYHVSFPLGALLYLD